MSLELKKATILTTKVRVQTGLKSAFTDWQAKLNAYIASFPGFISLEIIAPKEPAETEWMIIQRFYSTEHLSAWKGSVEHLKLLDELRELLSDKRPETIQEVETSNLQGGVTEVFITEVSPDKETAFREWMAKIHQVEAKFPGFQGMYVQSPSPGRGKNWITFLQFDTTENLDRWLTSSERQAVLKESEPLIEAIESHRVISSYAGWFSSVAKKGELPPVWKQTMIVLLVLFPIVMLEIHFLYPLLTSLSTPISTFIGNTISVSLISWPLMPIAIYFLGWWLSPEIKKRSKTIMGFFVVIALYVIEILISTWGTRF